MLNPFETIFQKQVATVSPFVIVLFLIIGNSAFATPLACAVSPALNNAAREYIFAKKLADPKIEIVEGEYTPRPYWQLVKTESVDSSRCVLVLQICIALDSTSEPICEQGPSAEYLVLGLNGGKLDLFENVFETPSQLRVAIGHDSPDWHPDPEDPSKSIPGLTLPKDLYYVELTGKGAIEAMKSVTSKINYCGFSGDISAKDIVEINGSTVGQPDGKLPFDPTPKRKWKIVNADFSMQRGSSIEIYDVRAGQLDNNFGDYFTGSGGHVAPWGACFIRKLWQDQNKTWIDVIDPLQ